jgi:hypothetical protein
LTKIVLGKNKKIKKKQEEKKEKYCRKNKKKTRKYCSNPQQHVRKATVFSPHVLALCIIKLKKHRSNLQYFKGKKIQS